MMDLFDLPVIPGIAAKPDFVSADEEAALMARIDALDLTPFRFQQWTGKRLTHSFGWNYDFQAGELSRAAPVPDWLIVIRDRMAAYASIEAETLVQALLTRYDVGAGIGWHRDRPVYEHVIGLSLGAATTMRFRRREGQGWLRASLPLESRGVYRLSGEARHHWEHSISEMEHVRYSITFRSPSAKGRSLMQAAW